MTGARFPLATMRPTPLVRARRLAKAAGGPPLWVKRDDLIGGNKVRALEFLMGDALAKGCDTLVTGGSPGSNFCAATAGAARRAGLGCHLVIAGTSASDLDHPNVTAARRAGASVHLSGHDDRDQLDDAIPALASELSSAGAGGLRPYAMPRGGATPVGALGYALAYRELVEQLRDEDVEPGTIVVAVGSGASLAGLLAGTGAGAGPTPAQPGWRLLGATVSRPPARIAAEVTRLADACRRQRGVAGRTQQPEIVDARGPGFGLPSPAGDHAATLAYRTEGLRLDATYTAKAMAVALDLAGADEQSRPIVFWHTGGVGHDQTRPAERSIPCPTST